MTAHGYAATVRTVGSTPPGTGDPVQFNPPELNPAAPAYPPLAGAAPLLPAADTLNVRPELSTPRFCIHTIVGIPGRPLPR